jgi:hypothetical protein
MKTADEAMRHTANVIAANWSMGDDFAESIVSEALSILEAAGWVCVPLKNEHGYSYVVAGAPRLHEVWR